MGFLCVFVDWVMVCVKTASQIIMINGMPYPIFPFKYCKRGLRQRDLRHWYEILIREIGLFAVGYSICILSQVQKSRYYVYAIQEHLLIFVKALEANIDKREVYLLGVLQECKVFFRPYQ